MKGGWFLERAPALMHLRHIAFTVSEVPLGQTDRAKLSALARRSQGEARKIRARDTGAADTHAQVAPGTIMEIYTERRHQRRNAERAGPTTELTARFEGFRNLRRGDPRAKVIHQFGHRAGRRYRAGEPRARR